MHEHLWDCSHSSHLQQVYIGNRTYLKHNVMAELEKIQFGLCMPEGLVKTASGKLFPACEPRMLLKRKPSSCFTVIFQNTNAPRVTLSTLSTAVVLT